MPGASRGSRSGGSRGGSSPARGARRTSRRAWPSAVDTIGGGAVALLATIIAAFNFTRSAAALFGRKAPDEVRFLP